MAPSPAPDPLQSLLDSVRCALAPLHRAAADLDSHWSRSIADLKLSLTPVPRRRPPPPLLRSNDDAECPDCFHVAVIWSVFVSNFIQAFPRPGNARFARVGGAPESLVGAGSVGEENGEGEESKVSGGLLSAPLSNVERLRSTLSTVSLSELIEFFPQLGGKSSPEHPEHPDKKKLFSVQDFFRYTESEGRRFFEELDRDGDGQVTLEDLEVAMGNRKLPRRYARDFLRRTRRHLFSKSIGWKQFLSLMEQKEDCLPMTILPSL